MKHFAIPGNFDIEQHLLAYPPTAIKPFKKEHLLYLISLVNDSLTKYKRCLDEGDFVPLNAEIMQSYIHNYKRYLEYLIETGVFITDNQFIRGEKCKGFQYTDKYRTETREIEFTDSAIISKIQKAESKQNRSAERKLPHLAKWFSGEGLRIDEQAAFAILKGKYQEKLNQKRSKFPFNKGKVHYTPKQIADLSLNIWTASIRNINKENRTFTIDDKGGRLFTCLTNLSKDFRKFVSYNGNALVHVDIANSQPYFSSILMNPVFWEKHFLKTTQIKFIEKKLRREELNIVNDLIIPPKLLSLKIKKSTFPISILSQYIYSILTLVKSHEMQHGEEFGRYRKLVSDGMLYDYLGEIWAKDKKRKLDKAKIKETVFGIFFSENKIAAWLEREEAKLINDLFPNVKEVFWQFKMFDYKLLSILLQNLESQAILHFICPAIAQKHPKIPLWTIHDSVVTTAGNEGQIKAIMEQELFEVTGLKPTLRTEYWV